RISFPWGPKSRSQWRSVEVVVCGLVGAGASACGAGAALGSASPPSLRAASFWSGVSCMSGGEDSAIDSSSPHGKQLICEGKNGCGSGEERRLLDSTFADAGEASSTTHVTGFECSRSRVDRALREAGRERAHYEGARFSPRAC